MPSACSSSPKKLFVVGLPHAGLPENRGLRIDHILVSEALKPTVTACVVDRAPRKNPQPSDHAPVVVTMSA